MTLEEAREWVREQGIVLESARGAVPSLAARVAGGPIRGSWWGHPKGHAIFELTRALRGDPDVLVCRLIDGKITYVHRRLWPAIARLADVLGPERLKVVREVHTPRGTHQVDEIPFHQWVSEEVWQTAAKLSVQDAQAALRQAQPGAFRE